MPSNTPSSSPSHRLRTELDALKQEQLRTNQLLTRLLEETEPPAADPPATDPPAEPASSLPTEPPSAGRNPRQPEFLEPRPAPTPIEEESLVRTQEEEAELVRQEADLRQAEESARKKSLAGRWI